MAVRAEDSGSPGAQSSATGRNTGPSLKQGHFRCADDRGATRGLSVSPPREQGGRHHDLEGHAGLFISVRETSPDVTAALRVFLPKSEPGATGAVALGTQSLDAPPEFSERTPLGFGDLRPAPAHREFQPEPGRPAIGRAVSRPLLAAGRSPPEDRGGGGEVGLNQSTACLRQRAREPGSEGDSPRPRSVPANAAARAAWNRFAVARSAASSGDDVERLGPQASRRDMLVLERRRAGRTTRPPRRRPGARTLHDRRKPRVQAIRSLRATQRSAGSDRGPAAVGRGRRGPGHRGPPDNRPSR